MNKQTKRVPPAIKKKLPAARKVQAACEGLGEFDRVRHQLIAERKRAGLSQAQIALRMGVAASAVGRLESGAQLPNLTTLVKYATAVLSGPIVIELRAA
jgi:DNA-binding XRE family transcriptional regulator